MTVYKYVCKSCGAVEKVLVFWGWTRTCQKCWVGEAVTMDADERGYKNELVR